MEENKSRIDHLQQKLDSPRYVQHNDETVLNNKQYNLKSDWDEGSLPEQAPSILQRIGLFRIFLGIAFVFFIASLVYAGFIFTRDNQPSGGDDVTISIVGPVSVGGGEKLSLDILIQNNNTVPIELVDLVVDYPEGTKSAANTTEDMRRTREDIGSIEPGAVVRRTINSVLFGEENNTKTLIAGIDYRLQGSSAIFEKRKNFEILLNASPIRITVDALREISAGQELEIRATLSSNSNKPLENVMLQVDYPFGFIFKSSDISPAMGNTTWRIPVLQPQQTQTIVIRGLVEGQNQEDRFFKFNIGLAAEDDNNKMGIVFNTTSHLTTIQKAFIDLALLINGSEIESASVPSGETVSGELIFSNNTNNIIRDIQIDMSILGVGIDKKKIEAKEGFYNSGTNTIKWNGETDEQFNELKPRESIKLQFRFDTVDLASGGINLRNPEIKIRAGVTGIRVSDDNTEEKIETIASSNIRIFSDVAIAGYTEFYEGPFTNSGSIPPTVEQETTYTLSFTVSNNSNDVKNARLEGVLPSYVSWSNLTSPESENVTFDYQTRKVSWNLGNIPAGTGYSQQARTLSFKVGLIPSLSQLNSAPDLMRNIVFSGTDVFTNEPLVQNLAPRNTIIRNHPIGNNHQNVVE